MTRRHRSGDPRPRRTRVTSTPLLPVLVTAVILVGCVVTQVARPAPAQAHNSLVSSTPTDGAKLGQGPAAVTLTFDEPVGRRFGLVVVSGPDGGKYQQGGLRVTGVTATQALRPLGPAGTYRVAWRVVSADGHPVSGSFSFRLEVAGAGEGPSPSDTSTATASPAPTGSPSSTGSPSPTVPPTPPASGPRSSGPSGGGLPVLPLAAGGAVLVLAAALLGVRRRRATSSGQTGEHTDGG